MSKQLVDLALKLYDIGFNVIPVDRDKRPLTKWSVKEHIARDELEKLLYSAMGYYKKRSRRRRRGGDQWLSVRETY